jgi:AsmA protein
MKTALKYFGIFVLILVVVIGGAALALPHLLSTTVVKNKVAALVEQKTGRKLTITGDTSFRLFPNIAVSLDDITLSNPPGMKGKPLVKMAALRTRLKLMPLLRGQTEIDSLALIKPRFHLQVDKQGNRNWDFNKTGMDRKAKTRNTRNKPAGKRFSLNMVSINDGTVRYTNAMDRIDEQIQAINFTLTHETSDALTAKGNLRWHNEIMHITSKIGALDNLLTGKSSNISAKLTSPLTDMQYSGLLTSSEQPSLSGLLVADTPSVRKLASFLGRDLPPGNGFGSLKLKTKIRANAKELQFTTNQFLFDNMEIVADGIVELKEHRPLVTAKLEIDHLDLTPYLASKNDSSTAGSSTGNSGSLPADNNEDAPVDLSALRTIDGHISLKTKEIIYKKAHLGEGHFNVVLKNGRANATIKRLSLYRGTAKGKFVVDGSGSKPFIGGNFSLENVLTGAILRDFAGFEKLAGIGNILGDFTVRGNTTKAFKSSLQGTVKSTLLDGRIEGFDLAKYVGGLTGNNIPGSEQSTDDKPMTAYDEMSAVIKISKGIARNKDFLMTGSFFRVRAAGTVDLIRQSLRLRIAPKLFSGDWNFAPPLRVTGPWSKPKVSFDTYAFLGGSKGVVRSLGGLLRGEKLDLDKALQNRGLQTDEEIENYLAGKKVDTSRGQPTNDTAPNDGRNGTRSNSPLDNLLGGDNSDAKKLLKGLFQ